MLLGYTDCDVPTEVRLLPDHDARGADRRRGYLKAVQMLGLLKGRDLSIGPAPVDCVGIGHHAGELLRRAIAAQHFGAPLKSQQVVVPFNVDLRENT